VSGPRRTPPAGRTEILNAATREFADHGYDGATTAEFERAAADLGDAPRAAQLAGSSR
jgi:AcrR family transcriptional regulator